MKNSEISLIQLREISSYESLTLLWQQACQNINEETLNQTAYDLESLLRELQRANSSRTFGVCKTCRHLQENGDQFHCGLTEEPLTAKETELICHEHEFSKAA